MIPIWRLLSILTPFVGLTGFFLVAGLRGPPHDLHLPGVWLGWHAFACRGGRLVRFLRDGRLVRRSWTGGHPLLCWHHYAGHRLGPKLVRLAHRAARRRRGSIRRRRQLAGSHDPQRPKAGLVTP